MCSLIRGQKIHTSSLYFMIVRFSLEVSTHVTKSSICLPIKFKKWMTLLESYTICLLTL